MANSRNRIDPVYVNGKLNEALKVLVEIQDVITAESSNNDYLKCMNHELVESKGNVVYMMSLFETYINLRTPRK